MTKLKHLILSYQHIVPFAIYLLIFILSYFYLENKITMDSDFHIIYMKLDDYIPFIECFIIPYYLWFPYVTAVVLLLCIKNKEEYIKCTTFLFLGMTTFLILSALWPNGHLLRPEVMPRENFFTALISAIHLADTPTNIVPSIHVYNAIGAHIGLIRCTNIELPKFLSISSLILCIAIILSTVFIKQHSIFDVFTAFILAIIVYILIYPLNLLRFFPYPETIF